MRRWEEVRAWRRAQREALIAQRLSIPRDERARCDEAITARLLRLLPVPGGQRSIGVYWPFKGEYDPRPLMRSLHGLGARLALPVVVERARPLVFREWWPRIRLVPGIWGIPVPAEGDVVLPDVLLVPLVGFDARGYRLGYGGGYYDRTLAALPERPLAIGIGFEPSGLETIHPQPHDIPMDLIVTEQRTIRVADAASGCMGGTATVDTAEARNGGMPVSEMASSAALRARLGDAVLGAVADAIVYADHQGVIRYWNPGAERLFGFAAAEAMGRSVDLIIPEPQRARHWAGFRKVMDSGESRYGDGDILAVPGLRRDGTRVSLEFTIVPIHAEDGRMEGMISIMRDVTRRFEEMRTLKRENVILREQSGTAPAQGSV